MNSVILFLMNYLVSGVIAIVICVLTVVFYVRVVKKLKSEPYKLLKFGNKCLTYGNKDGKVNTFTMKDILLTLALWPIVIIYGMSTIDKILNEL